MNETTKPVSAFLEARAELQRHGISLLIVPGQFQVNFTGGLPATAEYADSLDEAMAAGMSLAMQDVDKLPPLGPMGRRNSRKGMMFKHNMRLAGLRRAVLNQGGK